MGRITTELKKKGLLQAYKVMEFIAGLPEEEQQVAWLMVRFLRDLLNLTEGKEIIYSNPANIVETVHIKKQNEKFYLTIDRTAYFKLEYRDWRKLVDELKKMVLLPDNWIIK